MGYSGYSGDLQGIRANHRVLEGYSRGARGVPRGTGGYSGGTRGFLRGHAVAARGTGGTLGYSRRHFGRSRLSTTRHCRHSRSSQQALDGYSWGYSWVLRRLWGVFGTTQGSTRTPRVRTVAAARSLGKERRVSPHAHKLSRTRTRLPACTHAPHSFRILSASLSLHRRIYKCISRCCCTDTCLMLVSRHVCARVCACACNERVRVHGCVCACVSV